MEPFPKPRLQPKRIITGLAPAGRNEGVIIGIPREVRRAENRIGITPETADRYVRLGLPVNVEGGVGEGLYWSDIQFEAIGASYRVGL